MVLARAWSVSDGIDFSRIHHLVGEGALYLDQPEVPSNLLELVNKLERLSQIAADACRKGPAHELSGRCQEIAVLLQRSQSAPIHHPLFRELVAWERMLAEQIDRFIYRGDTIQTREAVHACLRNFSCFWQIRELRDEQQPRVALCVMTQESSRFGELLGRTIDQGLRAPEQKTMISIPRGGITLRALAERLRRVLEKAPRDSGYAQGAEVKVRYLSGERHSQTALRVNGLRVRVSFEPVPRDERKGPDVLSSVTGPYNVQRCISGTSQIESP